MTSGKCTGFSGKSRGLSKRTNAGQLMFKMPVLVRWIAVKQNAIKSSGS